MPYTTQYPGIKRVDVHTHIGRGQSDTVWARWLSIRTAVLANTGADIAAWVDLDGGAVMPGWIHRPGDGMQRILANGEGRILPTVSDYRPAQRLTSVTPSEIATRKNQGFCGYKWHWNAEFNGGVRAAHGLISDSYFAPWLAAMEEARFPLMCLHLEAPHGNMGAQLEALYDVLARYPNLPVIQAHFGAQKHGTLDDHARLFERYPNFYRDISTTAQNMPRWRPTPSVNECRAFFEAYSHRLLWGTDNMVNFRDGAVNRDALANKCALQFEYWETDHRVPTQGIGKTTSDTPEYVDGMALSEAALKRIYWENAIRLVPNLRESLVALGYSVPGTEPVDPPTMLAPSNLRLNAAKTRLLWDYTDAPALTGFRLRIPSPTAGGAPTTRDIDRSARFIVIGDLDLASGTYVMELRALGGTGSGWAQFPSLTIGTPPAATQICANNAASPPRADWTVNLGTVESIRIKIDNVEMIQGGPRAVSAPLPSLANGAHTLKVEALNGGAVGASAQVSFTLPSSANTCSGALPERGVFRALHKAAGGNPANTILDPSGNPIKLRGFRVGRSDTQRAVGNPPAPRMTREWIQKYKADSVAGNCQALEVWWSSNVSFGPGEPDPTKEGEYNRNNTAMLKQAIKNLKAEGIWSVISIRVSYHDEFTLRFTTGENANGNPVMNASGWANHNDVVLDTPVIINGRRYGTHRERFFNWLDWLIADLVSDPEVANAIAYWEMWHYCGHKHGLSEATKREYLYGFMPRLIDVYRRHEPSRLLGAGLVADDIVEFLIEEIEANRWTPWTDSNFLYLIAGYGVLGQTMRYNADGSALPVKTFPSDSVNPQWLPNYNGGKFNIEKLADLMNAKGWGACFHEQEGPGLINWWRRNPIPAPAKAWFIGMINLYNRTANGFSIHRWPPLDTTEGDEEYLRRPSNFSEVQVKALLQAAMRGDVLS